MSELPITVVARVQVRPEQLSQVEPLLMGLIPPTRAEAGNIAYNLHQSIDDPCHFQFIEVWESQQALDRHLDTPHLKAVLDQADSIFAEPMEITLWHMISTPA